MEQEKVGQDASTANFFRVFFGIPYTQFLQLEKTIGIKWKILAKEKIIIYRYFPKMQQKLSYQSLGTKGTLRSNSTSPQSTTQTWDSTHGLRRLYFTNQNCTHKKSGNRDIYKLRKINEVLHLVEFKSFFDKFQSSSFI